MAHVWVICDKLPIMCRVTGQQFDIAYLSLQAEDESGRGH
jgi:hypothetical protein